MILRAWLVLLCAAIPAAADQDSHAAPETGSASQERPAEEASLQQQMKQLYEKAKQSGQEVSSDIYEWAKEDLESSGDWEYRVEIQSLGDPVTLEEKLNELGTDRWECFWVFRFEGKDAMLFFKRPRSSLIRSIPHADLLRLLSSGAGEEEAP